jgi:hypothetical protein
MSGDIDTDRLWRALGNLEAAARNADAQRAELIGEIRQLRVEQERQRRDHDRLVNRGYGVLLGVGAIAGSVGAAVKSMFTGGIP